MCEGLGGEGAGVTSPIPLAHSASAEDRDPQSYAEHTVAVREGASERAAAMLRFAMPAPTGFMEAVEAAGAFHDLGKLDPHTQGKLAEGRGATLCWDHIDAGVAHLTACRSGMAAWLVRAHHAPGLPSQLAHFDKDGLGRRLRGRRRDDEDAERHEAQIARTNSHLTDLLAVHNAAVGAKPVKPSKVCHGLEMRLALSCLIDADHEDTARFDNGFTLLDPPQPRWTERLASLDAYITSMPPSGNVARDRHRHAFYEACRNSPIEAPLVACEGPVGIGKTTAVTAYLLRRAEAEGLRRLVVVAPYTNIISQTVETLRKALTLSGESPDEVVVEHHHRADFGSREARNLAVLWRAPIVVTTAVQFFETLAANAPGALRKLHALPGSGVFIDEAHAALPAHLWPQNWFWLKALANRWSCRFVFASGSLARFWGNADVINPPETLPELLGGELRQSVLNAERQRVHYERVPRFERVDALMDAIVACPSPRLVILNTVQSAAVVARAMREARNDVLHLSTALAPKDRAPILALIREKLKTARTDWTLVATSCVEAGIDLSFRTAFRERFSAASLVQTGGRVNRHGESEAGVVIDFLLDTGGGITAHPAATHPARVLGRLLNGGAFDADDHDPAAIVSRAMAEEIRERGGLGADLLKATESQRDYPCVANLGRVIDADTRVVVVDRGLARRIKRREYVAFRDLLAGSVQLWAHKIDALRLDPLWGKADVYQWPYEYDPTFLGVMEGMLRLVDLDREGAMLL